MPTDLENLQHAVQLHQAGKLPEAEAAYRQHLQRQPLNADAMGLLGALLFQRGEFAGAAELFQSAADLNPNQTQLRLSLGTALESLDRWEEAAAEYRTICQPNSTNPSAWEKLGAAAKQLNQIPEAIAAFQMSVQLQPSRPESHYNLAQALLLNGELTEGFKEFEWRRHLPGASRGPAGLEWDGSNIAGKTLFVYPEYGFGDFIQFIRYAPEIASRGGKMIVGCWRELADLLKTVDGISEIVPAGSPLPKFDVHARVMSLPRLLGTTMQTIPRQVPYLRADAQAAATWAFRLQNTTNRPRIGIAWSGNPLHTNDRNRSIDPKFLSQLTQESKVDWHSLQPGNVPAPNIQSHGPALTNFAQTAGMIANLDLVISVDTAVAHLAGAMGKPVWLVLPFAPDWRWLLNRIDSPWYPTMRIYRQTVRGDWTTVLAMVRTDSRKLFQHQPL